MEAANAHAGFTLVELMVTIAVLAIVLAIAIPSFQYIRNISALSAGANEVVAGLQMARAEAIRSNRRVVFCRANAGACDSAAGSWSEWLIASDEGGDGTFGNQAGEVITSGSINAAVQLLPSAAISGSDQRVVFRPDGMSYDKNASPLNGAFAICIATDAPPENVRRVSVVRGGRVASERVNGGGACATPAN